MLTLVLPKTEFYDEKQELFVTFEEKTIRLEHSLAAISKWESIWERAFLTKTSKTLEETLSYIECMSVDNDEGFSFRITKQHSDAISNYINAKMTATVFFENGVQPPPTREIITSEIIYYWMIASNIPTEYQNWHLNKLLALIRVCNIKNAPPKKMTRAETFAQNRALNEQRRALYGTRG